LSANGPDKELKRLRLKLVAKQLKTRGISDEAVLEAFETVPRHLFVPEKYFAQAYEDHPLSIGHDQTISQPYMVAIMTEKLEVEPGMKVLEIGTGSGYQAAILARLEAQVYSVERLEALSVRARANLEGAGYENIRFNISDGTLGWPEEAPFDRIIVTAGAPKIPDPLREQLADDGILVIPVGDRCSQVLTVVRKRHGQYTTEQCDRCVFVKLTGIHGW